MTEIQKKVVQHTKPQHTQKLHFDFLSARKHTKSEANWMRDTSNRAFFYNETRFELHQQCLILVFCGNIKIFLTQPLALRAEIAPGKSIRKKPTHKLTHAHISNKLPLNETWNEKNEYENIYTSFFLTFACRLVSCWADVFLCVCFFRFIFD